MNVAIYRDTLLAVSETFVASQAESLRRYNAFYVSRAWVPHGCPVRLPAVVLRDVERFGRLQDLRYRMRAGIPARWLARIAAFKPQLLHAHFGTDGVRALALARALSVPFVVTFHGFDITIRDDWSPAFRAYAHLRRRLFREANMILAVSSFIAQRLIGAGCPPEKVHVHHIGVDSSRFPCAPREGREPIVLFVGRLVETKGANDLLEAMVTVQSAMPDLRLVIIGAGPDDAALKRKADALRLSCVFLGAQPMPAVAEWMRRALVFCVPSVTASSGASEAFGLVFIEAQSSGLPVVSTTHGGIPEAVSDGVSGLLVSERDPAALAAAIMRVASDSELWSRFSRSARERVETHFELIERTAELETLYDQALRSKAWRPATPLPIAPS